MTIGILQPGYLPWLGFFEQIQRADVFVIYDDVQYDKNGWRNRNRIKTKNGVQWLTVPAHVRGFPLINEVKIDNSKNWQKDHLQSLKVNYSRAPYFKAYFPKIEEILSKKWTFLANLDIILIRVLAEILGIKTNLEISSKLKVFRKDRIERLINICKHFGADIFYEGAGGRNYIKEPEIKAFEQAGIQIVFQNYQHPVYRQLHGEFISHLSVIDLIFNEGPNSLKIICQNQKPF
ncbi:MAG: WbqC family protein [Patescibacteria group bacterium]|nr:WbqC family protein [Patescibacteria group bacterium]